MTKLNFKCNKCNNSFELEVKNATFGRDGNLSIEEEITCLNCGNLKKWEYSFPEEINKTAVGELYFEFMKKEHITKYMSSMRKNALKRYRPGQMFNYKDAFNQEALLNHTIDGKEYYMLDSYCVMPDCKCKDVTLNFVEKEDGKAVKEAVFTLMLNYEIKNIAQANDINEETAKNIVESFTPETINMFWERHKKLKEELNEDVTRILQKYKRKIPELPKLKIGRNDPCPCGSGKKYKKCCLWEKKQTND
jgi:transposase-like protein